MKVILYQASRANKPTSCTPPADKAFCRNDWGWGAVGVTWSHTQTGRDLPNPSIWSTIDFLKQSNSRKRCLPRGNVPLIQSSRDRGASRLCRMQTFEMQIFWRRSYGTLPPVKMQAVEALSLVTQISRSGPFQPTRCLCWIETFDGNTWIISLKLTIHHHQTGAYYTSF